MIPIALKFLKVQPETSLFFFLRKYRLGTVTCLYRITFPTHTAVFLGLSAMKPCEFASQSDS
jgi:hypothetical protein